MKDEKLYPLLKRSVSLWEAAVSLYSITRDVRAVENLFLGLGYLEPEKLAKAVADRVERRKHCKSCGNIEYTPKIVNGVPYCRACFSVLFQNW